MTRIWAAAIGLMIILSQGAAVAVRATADAPYVPVPPKPGESRHPDQMEKNRKACEQSDAKACASYGDAIYVTALEGNLTKTMTSAEVASMSEKGYTFKDKACLLGEDYTCSALGYAYQYGHGVPINMGLAYGYFAIACNGMPEYCKNRDELSAYASSAATNMAKQREKLSKQTATPARPVAVAAANAQTPSFESLEAACIAGNQPACTDAGIMMTDGNGIRKDEVRGAQLFLSACVQNDARACMLWGYALENGRGIELNLPEARKAYEGGCTGGNALGCNNAGLLYQGGKGGPRDEAMAKSFYTKACDMDLGLGCRNLGVLHADAVTLPQSRTNAVISFDKACRLGDMDGCNKQAWHAEQGMGTARDIEQARTLYAKACNAQYALACQNGKLLAAKYPAQATAINSATSAKPVAVAGAKTNTVPANISPAPKVDDAARMKDPEYLHIMGGNAYSSRDYVKAREYYNKACLAGRRASCGYVGLLYHDALGGKKDFAKSFPMFKKGCDAKDGFFCKYVGDAYAKGEGVKINAKTAQKFYKMACDLGDQMGCAFAK